MRSICTICICLFFIPLFSQLNYKEYDGQVQMEGYHTLMSQNKVVGYTINFRQSHKGNNLLSINIMDVKADLVFRLEIPNADNLYVIEAASNSDQYAILFLNTKQKQIELKLFDQKGRTIRTLAKGLTPADFNYFVGHIGRYQAGLGINSYLFELGAEGFALLHNTIEENLYVSGIYKIGADSSKDRVYNHMTDIPIYDAKYLGKKGSLLLFSFEKSGKVKNSVSCDIVGLNTQDMEPQFSLNQANANKQIFIPISLVLGNTGINSILFGRFYQTSHNFDNPYHDGVGIVEIADSGVVVQENFISFQSGFKDLKFNQDNKSSEVGFIFTHQAFRTKEGHIFLVSEGYKKMAAQGGNIGFGSFGGFGWGPQGMMSVDPYIKMRTMDLIISEFDSTFRYVRSYIHEKKSNSSTMNWFDYHTVYQIGSIFNHLGAFDYLYSEIDAKDENINIYFRDYARESNSLMRVNKLVVSDKEPLVQKLEKLKNTEATYFVPNSFHQLMIMEYINRRRTLYFEFK